jgi:hypothetical protein
VGCLPNGSAASRDERGRPKPAPPVFADPVPASRSRRSVTVRIGNSGARRRDSVGFRPGPPTRATAHPVASEPWQGASSALLRTLKPGVAGGCSGQLGFSVAPKGAALAPGVDKERCRAVPNLPTGSARDRRRRSGFLSRRRRWSARTWRSPLRSSLRASRDRPRSDRNRRNGNTVAVPAWPSERETLRACPGKPTSCR